MLPAFLITVREVIEASLIVATILGILSRLGERKGIRTVVAASAAAAGVSILLLIGGSIIGVSVRELYTGRMEEFIEGVLMIASAVFITWAVFFLHSYFGKYKTRLLLKVRNTVGSGSNRALFLLAFTAVFREGFEIVLFLSAIYVSSDPRSIFIGFVSGTAVGLGLSFALFAATLKLPVFYAFRTTSALLILFAAGLFARGVHEFAEAGLLPEIGLFILPFIPAKATLAGDMVKAVFGLTRTMDALQLTAYTAYTAFMLRRTIFRRNPASYVPAGRKDAGPEGSAR